MHKCTTAKPSHENSLMKCKKVHRWQSTWVSFIAFQTRCIETFLTSLTPTGVVDWTFKTKLNLTTVLHHFKVWKEILFASWIKWNGLKQIRLESNLPNSIARQAKRNFLSCFGMEILLNMNTEQEPQVIRHLMSFERKTKEIESLACKL